MDNLFSFIAAVIGRGLGWIIALGLPWYLLTNLYKEFKNKTQKPLLLVGWGSLYLLSILHYFALFSCSVSIPITNCSGIIKWYWNNVHFPIY